MDAQTYLLSFILVAALATFLTRALPFVLFSRHSDHPLLEFLGRYLPPVLMVLLVVYAMRDALLSGQDLLPSLLALGVVVGLQLWLRNALISIGGGTALYMLLVQGVIALPG